MDSALPLSRLPRLSVYSEAPCLTSKSPLVKHYVCSAVTGCGRWRPLLVIGRRAVAHRRRAVIGSGAPEARQKSPRRSPSEGPREGPGREGGCRAPSLAPRPPAWLLSPQTPLRTHHQSGHRATKPTPGTPLAAQGPAPSRPLPCSARASPAGASEVLWSSSKVQG